MDHAGQTNGSRGDSVENDSFIDMLSSFVLMYENATGPAAISCAVDVGRVSDAPTCIAEAFDRTVV